MTNDITFYQSPKSVADNETIKMSDRFCFMFLYNRKRLSTTKGHDFYDKDRNDYYIIYSQEEMAKKLDVSTKTVGRIYGRLEALGLIKREDFARSFNAPKKIFLPNFFISPVKTKRNARPELLSGPEQTKEQPSNNEPSKNKLSDLGTTTNTVNTEKRQKAEDKDLKQSAIDTWVHSVSGKLNLDKSVVRAALDVTNNSYQKVYELIGLVLKAKKNIVNTFKLGPNSPVTRFENNSNLARPLADKIVHASLKAPYDATEKAKYLMTAFKEFFKNAFGLIEHEDETPFMISNEDIQAMSSLSADIDIEGPDIPIFKIQ